ncbi:MAG TPA: CopD family protein [Dehalococcoidia bacterium]|nr:CopD family protein [Dehalococcoidia bacterium]
MKAPARLLLSTATVIVALIALALAPSQSSAHALLVSADPGINASLREAPGLISASFTEPLEHSFSTLEVYDPSGERVDVGGPIFNESDDKRMSVEVEGLTPAIYTVVWKTLSRVDGHTYVGSYTFTLLNPDGSPPEGGSFVFTGDTGTGGSPTGLDGVFKAIGLFAAVMLAGMFIFLALVAMPATRRLGSGDAAEASRLARLALGVTIVLFAMAAISEIYLLIEQLNQVNGGLGEIDDVLFDSSFGRWLVFRVLMLVVVLGAAIAAYRVTAPRSRLAAVGVAALAAVAVLFGTSMVSHGAAAQQGSFWGTASDFLHLVFAAVWLGSLAFLTLTWFSGRSRIDKRAWPAYFGSLLGLFSALAASSVVLVLVSGITNAVIEIPSLSSLTDTDYGIAFIVKMALVAVLFAVGAVNALVLRPSVIRSIESKDSGGREKFEGRLSKTIRIELLVAVAVFVATGVLTQLPTARVVAQQAEAQPDLQEPEPSAFTGEAEIEGGSMSLLVNPARVGLNRFEVDLSGDIGDVTEVFLDLEHPTAGASQVQLEPVDEDTFATEGSFFGLDGPWSVQVTVRRVGLDDAFGDFGVQVLPATPPLATDVDGGAFALPAPQLDWNTVGGIWLLGAGALLLLWREPLSKRFDAAGASTLGGAAFSLFVGFALIAGGSHSEPGADLENPVPLSDASVASGEMLYMANCVQCHGETGRGDGPLAADLKPPPANFFVHVPFHTDGTLFSWINEGVPGTAMPAWGNELTEEEMWNLVNYLRANYNEPPPTDLEEIRTP